MIDKTTATFLRALAGAGGMAILLSTWLVPVSLSYRIILTIFSLVGIFGLSFRELILNIRTLRTPVHTAIIRR